ncbi:HAD-IIIA family hydrolase [Streptomyces sp. NPDC046862]|uniref:D-glycero-alpha-D-manno-heptose-1,7-bisphosphate 7-phosphatase n=1 Tax=Streptomyces sp. NPDC046862 TaxID=3154603 RepID=UPI003454DDE8
MTTDRACVMLRHRGERVSRESRPTVFLDRDGVLIENRDAYVRRASDVALIPGAIDAVRLLGEYRDVVIVTNQAVIGRGLVPAEDILAIHRSVIELFEAQGARLVGSVLCPHAPVSACACRKPQPGMLLAACRAWGCQLEDSWIVGDAVTDVQAGAAAGCRTMLVRTGRGADHEDDTRRSHPDCVVVPSLPFGVDRLLAGPGHDGCATEEPDGSRPVMD